MGPRGMARRGRRRGLIMGAAVGGAAARRRGSNPDNQQNEAQGTADSLAELEKLGELHDKGILTDEEFQLKKNHILEE